MASRRLTDLLPACYKRAENFVVKCENAGIDILVYCTYRGLDEQEALYVQGRLPLVDVNAARSRLKFAALTSRENRIVTNAKPGESMHNYRLAFDCVAIDGGKLAWWPGHPSWEVLGAYGSEAGLEWAGWWLGPMREFPHFQYTGGLSLAQIKKGEMPI